MRCDDSSYLAAVSKRLNGLFSRRVTLLHKIEHRALSRIPAKALVATLLAAVLCSNSLVGCQIMGFGDTDSVIYNNECFASNSFTSAATGCLRFKDATYFTVREDIQNRTRILKVSDEANAEPETVYSCEHPVGTSITIYLIAIKTDTLYYLVITEKGSPSSFDANYNLMQLSLRETGSQPQQIIMSLVSEETLTQVFPDSFLKGFEQEHQRSLIPEDFLRYMSYGFSQGCIYGVIKCQGAGFEAMTCFIKVDCFTGNCESLGVKPTEMVYAVQAIEDDCLYSCGYEVDDTGIVKTQLIVRTDIRSLQDEVLLELDGIQDLVVRIVVISGKLFYSLSANTGLTYTHSTLHCLELASGINRELVSVQDYETSRAFSEPAYLIADDLVFYSLESGLYSYAVSRGEVQLIASRQIFDQQYYVAFVSGDYLYFNFTLMQSDSYSTATITQVYYRFNLTNQEISRVQ